MKVINLIRFTPRSHWGIALGIGIPVIICAFLGTIVLLVPIAVKGIHSHFCGDSKQAVVPINQIHSS